MSKTQKNLAKQAADKAASKTIPPGFPGDNHRPQIYNERRRVRGRPPTRGSFQPNFNFRPQREFAPSLGHQEMDLTSDSYEDIQHLPDQQLGFYYNFGYRY